MAMRIVIAITTVTAITTATTPPMMATVLSELEPAGAAAVCGGGVTGVVTNILSPGPTGAAHSGKKHRPYASYCTKFMIPDIPAAVDVLTVTSYSAPGCSPIMIT